MIECNVFEKDKEAPRLTSIGETELARTVLIYLGNIAMEKGITVPSDVLRLAFDSADDLFLPISRSKEWTVTPTLERLIEQYNDWYPSTTSKSVGFCGIRKRSILSELGVLDMTQCVLWFLQEHANSHNVIFSKQVLSLAYGCCKPFERIGVNFTNKSALLSK